MASRELSGSPGRIAAARLRIAGVRARMAIPVQIWSASSTCCGDSRWAARVTSTCAKPLGFGHSTATHEQRRMESAVLAALGDLGVGDLGFACCSPARHPGAPTPDSSGRAGRLQE